MATQDSTNHKAKTRRAAPGSSTAPNSPASAATSSGTRADAAAATNGAGEDAGHESRLASMETRAGVLRNLAAWIDAAAALGAEWTAQSIDKAWLWPWMRDITEAVSMLPAPTHPDRLVDWHGAVCLLEAIEQTLQRVSQLEQRDPDVATVLAHARSASAMMRRVDGQESDEAARSMGFDIESDIFKAKALSSLAEWVATARQCTERLSDIVHSDENLAEHFKRIDFQVDGDDWGSAELSGLRALHQEIGACLGRVEVKSLALAGLRAST